MARLVTTGFENGSVPNGAGAGGSVVVAADGSRGAATGYSSSYRLELTTSNNPASSYIYIPYATSNEIYFRVAALRTWSNQQGSPMPRLIRFDGPGGIVAEIRLRGHESAAQCLYWNKAGGTNNRLRGWVHQGVWHVYTGRLKNAPGAYEFELYVDGFRILNYADASPVGTGTYLVYLLCDQGASGAGVRHDFDDIAINDTTGSINNSWIADGTTVALIPNANGSASEMVGSDGNSTDNYLLVDERGHNSDTDYVATDAPGKKDWYATSSPTLSGTDTFDSVQLEAVARRNNTSALNVQVGAKSGATEAYGATVTMTTSYAWVANKVLDTDPATSAAWTQSGVDNLEIGTKAVL